MTYYYVQLDQQFVFQVARAIGEVTAGVGALLIGLAQGMEALRKRRIEKG